MSHKPLFARFLAGHPERLHFAAHSHHPWPDATFAAQQRAWLDAAEHHDDKWDLVFEQVLPEFQRHVAGRLRLPDPSSVAVAPNTHDLVRRILSCLPSPARVLTTDAEFHSFARQIARLEEDGAAAVERVAAEPFESLPGRLIEAAGRDGHDLVYASHVLFDSGLALRDLEALVAATPDDGAFVVIDGYHSFMALPTDLSRLAARAFYLAGGYKYAMAGEGAAFAHCPPGYGPRPRDTGWYAGFSALTGHGGAVGYPADARRFLGATFDPSGLYRFNAVQRLLDDSALDVPAIHRHVADLQARFLTLLAARPAGEVSADALLPPDPLPRGHFLTFRTPHAGEIRAALAAVGVTTDHRGDRLRIGFGIYHDPDDVDELHRRLVTAADCRRRSR